MNESCVETPAAPEWLSKLELRRETLTKRRLGHESGAGSLCLVRICIAVVKFFFVDLVDF